jgi:hypothetical protein
MAYEIPDHFSESFTTNVELLLQRQGGALVPYVTMGSYTGKSAQVVKQFGTVEFQTKTTRSGDTTWSDIQHKQRWVFPTDYNLALPIDNEDELRMLNSPLSPYTEAMRAAASRKMDDIIIDAFDGTSKTGTNGGTSTTFDSAMEVAVGAVGLTVAKLRAARKLLLQNHVNLKAETPIIAVTAQQMDDLLGETEVTSADFSAVKALVSGEIDTFMGFKFISTEGLDVDGSDYRKCPFWVPSGMHMGMWNGLETKIGERADKEYTVQVFMRMSLGACRTQEGKVGRILCAE